MTTAKDRQRLADYLKAQGKSSLLQKAALTGQMDGGDLMRAVLFNKTT